MKNYLEFTEKHGITRAFSPVAKRSGDNWDSKACHFYVALSIRKPGESSPFKVIWEGEYSCGFGIAESWAKKNKSLFVGLGIDWQPLPYGRKYYDSAPYVVKIREKFSAKKGPDLGDILFSLQCDISGSDETFENWAADYGYDADSKKAEKIWQSCNDTRRKLRDSLGQVAFDEFLTLEEV